MMSPQLDTDSINTTASSAKSTTSIRTSDHAVQNNSMENQESAQRATTLKQLTAYVDAFFNAALDPTSALQRMLAGYEVHASDFMMSGVSKVTPSWIHATREEIRGKLIKPLLETEGVAQRIASDMLDLGEYSLLGVSCSITLLLPSVIELVSQQDSAVLMICAGVCRLFVVHLFLWSNIFRMGHATALRNQATSSTDPVIRAALHQHLDEATGLWWWICPLVCPIAAAIFGFDVFIALAFSIALVSWADIRRASALQKHTIRLSQLSEKKDMPETTSCSFNAVLATSLLASREEQLKVEHERFAALEQQHRNLEQQLQIERVQQTDAIDWYVRTTGVLGDQVHGAKKEADNFRSALIDWHKYLTKQNDASKKRIDALETRNKVLEIECGTTKARNRTLEEIEATYVTTSKEHNEQNKSLREELRVMNSRICSLNELVNSTNEKLHQKEEDFSKLQDYAQQKHKDEVEMQSQLSAKHRKEVIELYKALSTHCQYMLARTQNEAKTEIREKVQSIATLEEHIAKNGAIARAEIDEKIESIVKLEEDILKKDATEVNMQAELNKAKAEIDEKVKSIITLEEYIIKKEAEIDEKVKSIVYLEEYIAKGEAIGVDLQAELKTAKVDIGEKTKYIMMLKEHILENEATDIDVRAELHKAKAEIEELEKTITMREESILETEATSIDIQAELDNANHVNLGIVDHLTTLKKTIASHVEDLATKDRINANLETGLRAKNASLGVLKNAMHVAHTDNAMLTKDRDNLMETITSLAKDLDQLKVTKTRADQELCEGRDRSSRAWQLLERASLDNNKLRESRRANGEGLARIIAHFKEELALERAKHETMSKDNANREASDAFKIDSMRADMQALVDENDELMGINEWDQVVEDEGEHDDVDSVDEMENEIDRNLDEIHKVAGSLLLQPDAEAMPQHGLTTQQPGRGSPSENDSVMEMADQKPTTGRVQTKDHDQDDEQDTYTSDESALEDSSESEFIDSEYSDDEDHLTPSRADIEYADALNSRWKSALGGVDIRQYEEISVADTEASDGELVDFTDVDDD